MIYIEVVIPGMAMVLGGLALIFQSSLPMLIGRLSESLHLMKILTVPGIIINIIWQAIVEDIDHIMI